MRITHGISGSASLIEEFGIPKQGVSIRLRKVIPIAAGMAGGSSDAAAVLVGLNRIFQLGLTEAGADGEAVKLGADVRLLHLAWDGAGRRRIERS